MHNQSPRNFTLLVLCAFICAIGLVRNASRLSAQDVKFTDPVPVINNPLLMPPSFAETVSSDNLDHLPDIPTYAYMQVFQFVTPGGVVEEAGLRTYSTNPEIRKAFPSENRNIQFRPAERDGTPVRGRVYYTLIYNPAGAPETGPDAAPRLLDITPVYVDRAAWLGINRESGQKEVAWLRATMDANGLMTKCVLEEDSAWASPLQDDIYKTVIRWEFAPARGNGKPVPAEIRFPVRVISNQIPPARNDGAPAPSGAARLVQPSPYVPVHDKSVAQLPMYMVTGTRTLSPPEPWYQ